MSTPITFKKATLEEQLYILQEPRLSKLLPDSPSMLSLPEYLKRKQFSYYLVTAGKYTMLLELYPSNLESNTKAVYEFHPMIPNDSMKVSRHLVRLAIGKLFDSIPSLYALATSCVDKSYQNMATKMGAYPISKQSTGKIHFILTRELFKREDITL